MASLDSQTNYVQLSNQLSLHVQSTPDHVGRPNPNCEECRQIISQRQNLQTIILPPPKSLSARRSTYQKKR